MSEQKAEEIRTFVATKNYPALNACLKPFADNPAAEQLCQLPKLFGGEETFKKANIIFTDDETKKVLEELKSLYKSYKRFQKLIQSLLISALFIKLSTIQVLCSVGIYKGMEC